MIYDRTPVLEAPTVIGRMYRVPCIKVETQPLFLGELWHPVIGPKHNDPVLKFDPLHYHLDWRFVSKDAYERACWSVTGSPHSRVISNTHNSRDGLRNAPVLHWRKCQRAMPDFPAQAMVGQRSQGNLAKLELQQRAHCDRLIDGHICPHRGFDLRAFVRPDGTAICPGHGLHWDLSTGELIQRHARSA